MLSIQLHYCFSHLNFPNQFENKLSMYLVPESITNLVNLVTQNSFIVFEKRVELNQKSKYLVGVDFIDLKILFISMVDFLDETNVT